jgi:glycine/D-amino acid oxidase-like deaminating enzyme
MLATAPLPAIRFTRPVYARWGYDYWQQLPDRRLALGGCRDYSEDTERTSDGSPGGSVQQHLERLLRDTLHIDVPITHRWAAVVSYTATVLPVFASPHPGVWAVGGYNGTGNLMGALYGRAAVRRAAGLPTVLDPLLPA